MRRLSDGESSAESGHVLVDVVFPRRVEVDVRAWWAQREGDGQDEDLADILENGARDGRGRDEDNALIYAFVFSQCICPDLSAIFVGEIGIAEGLGVGGGEGRDFAAQKIDPSGGCPMGEHVIESPGNHLF